jgi:integrase
VDWLGQTIRVERGVVKQIVDYVKTANSVQTMVAAPEILNVVQRWKSVTQFSSPEDWVFASTAKLGRQPLSYTHVWETLNELSARTGIGHAGSHVFRHSYQSWLDSVGTPVDIRTTMNIYGDAATDDMKLATGRVAQLALANA